MGDAMIAPWWIPCEERLIKLGLKPAKPNIFERIYYAIYYALTKDKDKCICGRPLGKVWRVNIDVFNGYVYDSIQGIGTEWVWTAICVNCYKKNIEKLKILEKEGEIEIGKEAYNKINGKWVWRPLDTFSDLRPINKILRCLTSFIHGVIR